MCPAFCKSSGRNFESDGVSKSNECVCLSPNDIKERECSTRCGSGVDSQVMNSQCICGTLPKSEKVGHEGFYCCALIRPTYRNVCGIAHLQGNYLRYIRRRRASAFALNSKSRWPWIFKQRITARRHDVWQCIDYEKFD